MELILDASSANFISPWMRVHSIYSAPEPERMRGGMRFRVGEGQ